jgi:hypothetical protein
MIGYSSFNAAFANFDEAAAQGQKVGATIVVVYFVHTRRIRYDIPDAVQNPIRTAGAHRIDDAYESGDYVTCGGPSVPFGILITPIPPSVERFDYAATYCAKVRSSGLGV